MFCKNIRTRIKSLLRSFNNCVNENIDLALSVTTNLKAFLESPLADIVTAIIPTEIDDKIKSKLVYALREILPVLSITKACEEARTVEDKLLCFAKHLKELNPDLAQAILHKLAALLAAKLDDYSLPQHLYDLYTQGKYSAAKDKPGL